MSSEAISSDMVAPELRGALAKVPSFPIRSALLRSVATVLMKHRRPPVIPGVSIEVRKGPPALRVYRPTSPRSNGALFWIHGGGYVVGTASIDDGLCATIVREAGVTVVSTEYRLAPRHAFPKPLDDCHASWRWLVEQADAMGIDPQRIVIGGLSAGGGLAAALLQRTVDEAGVNPAGQLLMAPMIDDRTAARTELDQLQHPVWDNALNRFGWASYLGQAPGAAGVAKYAVPSRREDMSGLPPAWIGVGEIELFHDEDVQYAQRLEAAGVPVELKVVPGAPHGFEAWGQNTQIGQKHVASAIDWLKKLIG